MKDYLKFLNKLPESLKKRVKNAITQIAHNNLAKLDIKQLSGKHNLYRCRVGPTEKRDFQEKRYKNIGFHIRDLSDFSSLA